MLLSVIIINENKKANIEECIASIHSQTWNDYEIIYVGNNIDDKIKTNIKKVFDNHKIKFIKNTNKYLALNEALKISTGKYISFVNSSDYLINSNSFKLMMDILEETKLKMISGNILFTTKKLDEKIDETYEEIIIDSDNYGSPMFFDKNIYDKKFLISNEINFPNKKKGSEELFLTKILSNIKEYVQVDINYIFHENRKEEIINVKEGHDLLESYYEIFQILFYDEKGSFNLSQTIKEYQKIIENASIKIKNENDIKKIKITIEKSEHILRNIMTESEFSHLEKLHIDFLQSLYWEYNHIAVSVIVPVYNVEKYLPKCLNSLINQTLSNIEIICIDDCSTDNSSKILEEYSKKDNRIKIIHNEYNRGPGASRNIGLEIIKGQYVFFMDSDDWIDYNTLEKLFNSSKKMDLDLLFYKLINYDDKIGVYFKTDYYDLEPLKHFKNKLFNNKSIENEDLFKLTVSPPNKLYSTKLIKKIHAKFPENVLYEDNPFFFYVFLNSNRISFMDEYLYIRRRRLESVTTKNDKYLSISVKIGYLLISLFIQNNWYDKYKKEVLNYSLNFVKYRLVLVSEKYKEEYFQNTKKFLRKLVDEYNLCDDLKNELDDENLFFTKNVFRSYNYQNYLWISNEEIMKN